MFRAFFRLSYLFLGWRPLVLGDLFQGCGMNKQESTPICQVMPVNKCQVPLPMSMVNRQNCFEQVSELLGRPLRRTFGPLLKAEQLHPGFGYDIVPPPPNMEMVRTSRGR